MHRTEHEFHSCPSVWTPDPLVRSVEWKESEVAQSCPTLCDPMDCSLPGFSIHGIFQARVLSGLPFPSPGDLPDPGSSPGPPHCRQKLLPSEPAGKSVE